MDQLGRSQGGSDKGHLCSMAVVVIKGHTHQKHSSAMFYPIAAEVSLCDDNSPSSGWGSGTAILHRTEPGGAARDLKVLHRQHLAGSSVGRTQAELPSAHPPAHACLGTQSPWVFGSL